MAFLVTRKSPVGRIDVGNVPATLRTYNIVSEQDLTDAVRKLQKFHEAAEPACTPTETQPCVPCVRPAFVN
jgi:hypothetical protein